MLAPWRIAASETLHPDAEESLRLHLAVARTAGPRRRFNRDWQQVGFDLMPVDVVARYMQRKETGFGDEKHELYQMSKQPPLSEQIKQRGYEKPVHLVTDGRSGTIYDGHHRIDIARQLGHTHIPVEVSWRSPYEDGSQMYDTKVDPWFKSWLTDMRRGRETVGRRITAMPAKDAYDDIVSPYNRSDSQEIHPGPWYHASDHDLPDGTILTPGGGASQWQEEDYYGNDRASRKNWVWVNHSPHQTRVWGEHLYQVEPMDEGPWEWNGGGQLFTDGYVSPRARIVRKVPHSELMDQIPDHFKPTKGAHS